MNLNQIQMRIKDKYYETDESSGPLFLLAVLFEEVGELAEAVRKEDKPEIQQELTDVLFMTLSIANLFGVELQDNIREKYIEGDPRSRWDLPSNTKESQARKKSPE
ncbi:MAG: MazG nucleotide pyrophosphohydrolase domain-containing protein [Archaeoglobaceae archaeon]